MPRAHGRRLIALAFGCLLLAGPAAAQGRSGQTPAANHPKHPGGGPPATQSATPTPATASLASWLDDASLLDPATGWVALAAGVWHADVGRDIEAPVMTAVAGVAPRVNLGAGVPIYHFRDSTGLTASGVGDVSLFAKFGLIDPSTSARHVGVALTPLVVIASQAPSDGSSRAGWALPVSLEARAKRARVYGSVGYFSAGAVFGTGALEVTATSHLTLTATVGHTYATSATSVTAGASRHRTDASVGAATAVTPKVSLFASVGHSFSGDPTVDGGPWIVGGVSFHITRH